LNPEIKKCFLSLWNKLKILTLNFAKEEKRHVTSKSADVSIPLLPCHDMRSNVLEFGNTMEAEAQNSWEASLRWTGVEFQWIRKRANGTDTNVTQKEFQQSSCLSARKHDRHN